MKINNLKKLALVGFAPFMMTGCTTGMNDTEEQVTTESVGQSIENTYDIEAIVTQTDDGIKIESNNSIVEGILRCNLPYDLSQLNIETLSIMQYEKSNNMCHIDISGKKGTNYKYKAEELLNNILKDLVSNNICDENGIMLNISNFEFDANTHFPSSLLDFWVSNCSGLLSENELKGEFSCWFDDCDIFLLDNDHSYPKVENLFYRKCDRRFAIQTEPVYLQQSLDYFASKYDVDVISIGASYEYMPEVSYMIDLGSISTPVEIYMTSYNPSTFEVKNASDISFDLCTNDGIYDKEKSEIFTSLAKEQLETNKHIDVTVSCIGGEPIINIGPSKKLKR